jgi:hypothetical protein
MSFERIRKIENELETGQSQNRGRSIIHDVKTNQITDSWDAPITHEELIYTPATPPETGTNWFKRVFIISIIFALLGGGVFGFSILFNPKNTLDRNVSVSVLARPSIDGGESFPVAIVVTNKNNVPLEFVKVTLEYPLSPDGDLLGLFQELSLDSIPAGEIKEIPFSVVLYGSANTNRILRARVSYRVPGSVALFESLGSAETLLRSSSMRLAIENTDKVFPNQEVSLAVTYASNLRLNSPASMFRIAYPTGFRFISADPSPDTGNNIWKLGTLIPGKEGTITIKGSISGVLGEDKIFSGTIGSLQPTQEEFESIYSTAVSQLKLVPSFLSMGIDTAGAVATGDRYVLSGSTDHDITLRFQNTQNTPITNVKISAKVSGNIWNPNNLQAGNGFYDSETDTIIWTSDQVPTLANIPPGGNGEIVFNISELSAIDSDGNIIKNPELVIQADAEAVSTNGQKLLADNLANNTYTLTTQPTLTTKLISTQNPIKNTGSYPPAAGKQSTYTVLWKLSNTISPLDQAVVTAKLPLWVTYTGVVSPQSAKDFITYNEATRTVTWSPGTVAPGVGYTSNPLEVYFQVAIKPSTSQIGSSPSIIGPGILTGRDQNVGLPINLSGAGLSTASSGDGKGVVTK